MKKNETKTKNTYGKEAWRNKELTPLRRLQLADLEMLKCVADICEKNGITYFLSAGTFLGAVRHKGFIPWDDDVDIRLPRPEYERLARVLRRELPAPYELSFYPYDRTSNRYYMRVIDPRMRVFYLEHNREVGAWMDIFPLDGMPKPGIRNKIRQYRLLFGRMMIHTATFREVVSKKKKRPAHEKAIVWCVDHLHLDKLVSFKRAWIRLDKTMKACPAEKAPLWVNFMGYYKFRDMIPKEVYGKGKLYPFEDSFFRGPENADAFLSALYGDYMQLPPEDKRNKHEVVPLSFDGDVVMTIEEAVAEKEALSKNLSGMHGTAEMKAADQKETENQKEAKKRKAPAKTGNKPSGATPKNVLIINAGSETFGGVSAIMLSLYRNMDREKYRFTFLSPNRTTYGEHLDEIRQLGGRVTALGADYHRRGGWEKLRKRLAAHLEKHSYDVIHIASGALRFNAFVLRVCRENSDATVIVHSHNSGGRSRLKNMFSGSLKKELAKESDCLLACSAEARDFMFPKKADCEILTNGIDFSAFRFTPEAEKEAREKLLREYNLPDNVRIIGHVGRFVEQKNHGYLIDWFRDFTNRYPEENAFLMLIGTGRLQTKIREQIQKIEAEQGGFSDRILFLGERQDMPELYRAMDLFVFPSLYEGFGLAVIEAEASGVPVLVSDHVPQDVIVEESPLMQLPLEAGFAEWSRAAKELIDKGKKPGESFVNAGQDIEKMAERLTEIYEKLI